MMDANWYEELEERIIEGEAEADWEEVRWSEEVNDSEWLTYSAVVGAERLVIRRDQGGLWYMTGYDADGDEEWSGLTFTGRAARFLSIIHADLAYLDMDQAAKIMAEFLESIDPDYVDLDTITDHGWQGFVDEEETCGHDYFATLTQVVLLDGTTITYDEDELEWSIER